MSEQIPNNIFLQIDDSGYDELTSTWCEDRINETDIEYVRKQHLPDDIQRMIDAAKVCETERHGCYWNNIECIYNRFHNGMGCLNNEHVTRLIEYITTGR